MYTSSGNLKLPSKRQIKIWNLNRKNKTGRGIAVQLNVDPSFVSRSINESTKRIHELLKEGARMNKIKPDLVSGELGFARGTSHMLGVKAYITFSPLNGLGVWYEHKGDCVSCEEFTECQDALLQELAERGITVPNQTLQPTDLSDLLIKKIEEKLE